MAQRCQCGHYRFGHNRYAGQCDDCPCNEYTAACDMCGGAKRVLVAAATDTVDWAHAVAMPCPRCSHG